MAKTKVCLYPPRVFLVDKPKGMHSGDVLKHFKYHLPRGYGKIGHLGTLDPFAEGLLVIAIGQAARLSFLFEEFLTKTYRARGVFHFKSTTGDSDGEITPFGKIEIPNSVEANSRISSFIGNYWQAPPYYSAAKHEGKALYQYAREGVLIDKEPVLRKIFGIRGFNYIDNNKKCDFEAEVSSGTYIRTLFEDIAEKLGTVGYLEGLRRTSIGDISLDRALNKASWPVRGGDFDIMKSSVCPSIFFQFQKLVADKTLLVRVENGQRIPVSELGSGNWEEGKYVWIFSDEGMLRGLAFISERVAAPKVIFPKIIQNN